jgi:hypothetical protein
MLRMVALPAASMNGSVPHSSSGELIVSLAPKFPCLSHHASDAIVVEVAGVMGEKYDFSKYRGSLAPSGEVVASVGRAGCSWVMLGSDTNVFDLVKKGVVM